MARTYTDRPATPELVNLPSEVPQSGRRSSSRPDAYLLMVNKKSVSPRPSKDAEKDAWDDVAVSFEFKKGAGEIGQRDNDQKIIWSLHHVMRTDPCRRATFGITIENKCRRHYPSVLLPGFAKDHELGWDTSIERVLYEDTIQYKITINGIVYQTVETLSDFGAEAMRGRGTRMGKEAKHVVIKDAWRDSDRKREDHILREILDDIERMGGDIAAAKQHFLTVLNQDDVKVEGVMDDTRQLLRGKVLPDSMSCHSRSGFPEIHHKQHFRLVFEEIGQPIYALRSLRDVSGTLDYAVKGLQYMHEAGWVHRDISSANVLRFEDRGLLMDLEYAKRMNSSESHGVRTGTVDFMACEVEAQAYRFLPDSTTEGDDLFMPATAPIARPPFRANPFHDLESLWWILMWVLHFHVDGKTKELGRGQESACRTYFPGLNLAEGRDRTGSLISGLAVDVLPQPFHPAARAADRMRSKLYRSYQAAEKVFRPSGPNFQEFYPECLATFTRTLIELYGGLKLQEDIRLVPLPTARKSKAT
ncbi:hypothetical protein BU15DRAFT_63578 [Melanogaster broomeanus]|nr:hypothetical protein BU15DRAFT_63578 [Melanogaster broomeanus]